MDLQFELKVTKWECKRNTTIKLKAREMRKKHGIMRESVINHCIQRMSTIKWEILTYLVQSKGDTYTQFVSPPLAKHAIQRNIHATLELGTEIYNTEASTTKIHPQACLSMTNKWESKNNKQTNNNTKKYTATTITTTIKTKTKYMGINHTGRQINKKLLILFFSKVEYDINLRQNIKKGHRERKDTKKNCNNNINRTNISVCMRMKVSKEHSKNYCEWLNIESEVNGVKEQV